MGKAITVRNGNDVTLISTGGILHTAVAAAQRLAGEGIHARVLSMHTVKPLDIEAVLAAARETRAIVTIEEHSVIGGLGSAVAETLAENGQSHVIFKRLGLPSSFSPHIGSQEYLRDQHGLSGPSIEQCLRMILRII